MPFTRNENKIVSIISNANLSSIRDGSKSTWKQNISRILGEQGKTNTQLTLFNSISNNLLSLDVSDSVELLMTDSPPILEQGTEKVDTPIARFITGGSDNKKGLESFKNLKKGKGYFSANDVFTAISTVWNTASAGAQLFTGEGGVSDTFMPWFANVPTYPPSEVKGITFTYPFKFNIGQYGLWNAKEEVVLPTLNLLMPVLLREISSLTITGPFPTTIQLLAQMLGTITDKVQEMLTDGVTSVIDSYTSESTEEEADTAIGKLSQTIGGGLDTLGNALQDIVTQSYNTFTFDVSFGNIVTYKKCLIEKANVKYSSDTDEDGYPIASEVALTFHSIIPMSASFSSEAQRAVRFGVE